MPKTITLRLSDAAYEAIRRHAETEQQSMNSWIESVLDAEDMRRRCAAHGAWMAAHPEAQAFAKAWAARNLANLKKR
ncbi:MAG: toxin-antitoxin system HicB family antitoxin [Sporichthyaceae bacterium]